MTLMNRAVDGDIVAVGSVCPLAILANRTLGLCTRFFGVSRRFDK